MRIFRKKM